MITGSTEKLSSVRTQRKGMWEKLHRAREKKQVMRTKTTCQAEGRRSGKEGARHSTEKELATFGK